MHTSPCHAEAGRGSRGYGPWGYTHLRLYLHRLLAPFQAQLPQVSYWNHVFFGAFRNLDSNDVKTHQHMTGFSQSPLFHSRQLVHTCASLSHFAAKACWHWVMIAHGFFGVAGVKGHVLPRGFSSQRRTRMAITMLLAPEMEHMGGHIRVGIM